MKKIYTIIAAVLITASTFAQAPEKMSYQAVVRDNSDALVANQVVGMQISILQGSASGTVVYAETQIPTTNINGLVSIEFGSGTVISGMFNTIDWSNGPYFIKTETDPTGGPSYTITGTSQLMSVPYALHANTADSLTSGSTWQTTGINISNLNTGNVGIGVTNPISKLEINGSTTIPSTSSYTYSSPVTKTIIIPGYIFSSENDGLSTTWSATLDLPNGAEITDFEAHVYDQNASTNMNVYLEIVPWGALTASPIITSNYSVGNNGHQYLSSTISSPITIDNNNNSYFLYTGFEPNNGLRLHGVKITYTISKVD
jgi:hypothetical protein